MPVPTELFVSLAATARRSLPPPADYYRGRRHGGAGLPDNILLFLRQAPFGPTESRHFHHRHVVVMVLRGEGRVVLNGRALALRPGRCAYIAPYQFHHFSSFSKSEIDWIFATFEWRAPDRMGSVFQPSVSFWEDACRLMDEYAQPANGDTGDRLACRLALLLSDLRNTRPVSTRLRGPHHNDTDLLLRVHQVVWPNLHRMMSIGEIGRCVGLSESHLRSRFRAATGKSLGTFQREMRLQKAAELLVRDQVSVSEAAEACGWATPFAFSRAFSRYWGRSPKHFSLFSKECPGIFAT